MVPVVAAGSKVDKGYHCRIVQFKHTCEAVFDNKTILALDFCPFFNKP